MNPGLAPYDRSVISVWEDPDLRNAIKATKRKKIIIAGLWTDNCVAIPVIQALEDGYDVYVVADASGDVNKMSHDMAMERMTQAGAVPITWLAVMLELQRDWNRAETASKVTQIAVEHGGAMGLANVYYRSVKK